jgi:putative phage-type endonuclease
MNRAEWLELRKSGIGGSDAAKALGLSEFIEGGGQAELYDEKIGVRVDEPQNDAIIRGRYFEPVALQLYQEKTGRKLRRLKMKRHRRYPWMHGSADSGQTDDEKPGRSLVEVKCVGIREYERMRDYGLRQEYTIQNSHYMEVYDVDWSSYAILCAELCRIVWWDMDRDREFGKQLIDREGVFWHKVMNRERPSGPVANLPDIPTVKGELQVRKDEEYAQIAGDLMRAKALKAEAEYIHKIARARLVTLLDAYGVYANDEVKVHYNLRDGRVKRDWEALKRNRPLDRNSVALMLQEFYTNWPNAAADITIETGKPVGRAAKEALERWLQNCELDFSPFERTGENFIEIKSYAVKQKDEPKKVEEPEPPVGLLPSGGTDAQE